MALSLKETWARILDDARREVPDKDFKAWVEPAKPVALESDRLVLGVPDELAVQWNESKNAGLFARLAQRALGRPVAVVFRVDEDRLQRPQMDFFVAPLPPAPGAALAANPSAQPLNERYSFGNFGIGKSNELAATPPPAPPGAEAPGKLDHPLFIYGAPGLGKTPLMQAIGHIVMRRSPSIRVLYVGAEQFINEVIESIHSRTMPELRRRYRNDVDLFLVDDVHFLEGKEATQEEFFHTFNTLYEGKMQIVLTSHRPPKEMPGLEARLVSRFEWGMVADVGQPDLEHRIAILRKKQEQDHLETTIPDEVLGFIAEHVQTNVRELEGCIIKLLLYASLRHREITVDLAREALADKIRPGQEGASAAPKTSPTIDKVQDVVARRWGVTPEGLRSKARIKTLTVPRQIAMYLD